MSPSPVTPRTGYTRALNEAHSLWRECDRIRFCKINVSKGLTRPFTVIKRDLALQGSYAQSRGSCGGLLGVIYPSGPAGFAQCGLGSSQARDGHAERRAGHVVELDLIAEGDRG